MSVGAEIQIQLENSELTLVAGFYNSEFDPINRTQFMRKRKAATGCN